MKNIIYHILNFLKGMLLGFICVATPGVSGGTIAAIVGLFSEIVDKGNDLLHNFFTKNWWKTVLFFVILVLGIGVGAVIGSVVVTFTYEKYPLATTMCIIGLIIGSFPMLFKNIKGNKFHYSNIITFTIVLALALLYTYCLGSGNNVDFNNMNVGNYLLLVLMGAFTTATMIIPGISGSIFLMAFGYYFPINDVLSHIFTYQLSFTLPVLGCFLVGCVIGAILVIKLIKILLTKFETKTTVAIFGFVVASPIIMVKLCILSNESFVYNTNELIVGIILLLVAFAISFVVGKLDNKQKS